MNMTLCWSEEHCSSTSIIFKLIIMITGSFALGAVLVLYYVSGCCIKFPGAVLSFRVLY